jgi:serine/threonine protein kinase
MPSLSITSLVEVILKNKMLEPEQLDELTRDLQARHADAKALATELVRRGWLTLYQGTQLLKGRGQELALGSYLLLEKVGAGGMGEVYKARHRNMGRIVAVKLIRKERLDNPAAIRRFQREVRAAAVLSHPHIVRAYDADEIGGTHLLVMEYIEGATDLYRLVKINGPLPVHQACDYIRQAALGLQHAHERGLVHRDIKPANLLLAADGKVLKILDMGLARLDHAANDDRSASMTHDGTVIGTPDYMAPEQALRSHTVDIRADLYSVGCTFYFLLTGNVPFPGGAITEKLLRHQLHEPTPVEKLRPNVPPGVVAVLRRLMAKTPEERYQSPAEAAAALASFTSPSDERFSEAALSASIEIRAAPSGDLSGAGFTGFSDEGGTRSIISAPRRQKRARPWLLVGVAGGFALLVGVAMLLLVSRVSTDKKKNPDNGDGPAIAADASKDKEPKQAAKVAWLKTVTAMDPKGQITAVIARLKELNPGFDGMHAHSIEGGVVANLEFLTDKVTDISPLAALTGLRKLKCYGSAAQGRWDIPGKGQLADLSPLHDLKLVSFSCVRNRVTDLSPLKDMRLTSLDCGAATKLDDLAPLKDMKLEYLRVSGTSVSDLTPLKDMKLTELHCESSRVFDLTPLRGMPLKVIECDVKTERDATILRSITTLEKINLTPAPLFWKALDEKKQ